MISPFAWSWLGFSKVLHSWSLKKQSLFNDKDVSLPVLWLLPHCHNLHNGYIMVQLKIIVVAMNCNSFAFI